MSARKGLDGPHMIFRLEVHAFGLERTWPEDALLQDDSLPISIGQALLQGTGLSVELR